MITLVDYNLYSSYLNNKGYEFRKQSKYDDANLAYDAAFRPSIELSIYQKDLPKLGIKRDSPLREMGKQYDEAVMMFNKAVEAFDRAIEPDGNLYGA